MNILNLPEGSARTVIAVGAEDFKAAIYDLFKEFRQKEKNATVKAPQLISRFDTAKQLNVSLSTLNRWEKDGYLVPVRIGSKVMYRNTDIESLSEKGDPRT